MKTYFLVTFYHMYAYCYIPEWRRHGRWRGSQCCTHDILL